MKFDASRSSSIRTTGGASEEVSGVRRVIPLALAFERDVQSRAHILLPAPVVTARTNSRPYSLAAPCLIVIDLRVRGTAVSRQVVRCLPDCNEGDAKSQ